MELDEIKELKRNTEAAIFKLLQELHTRTEMNITSLDFDSVQSRKLTSRDLVFIPASFKINLSLN